MADNSNSNQEIGAVADAADPASDVLEMKWWEKQDGDDYVARDSVGEDKLISNLEFKLNDEKTRENFMLPYQYRYLETLLLGNESKYGPYVLIFWKAVICIWAIAFPTLLATGVKLELIIMILYLEIYFFFAYLFLDQLDKITRKSRHAYTFLEYVRSEEGDDQYNEAKKHLGRIFLFTVVITFIIYVLAIFNSCFSIKILEHTSLFGRIIFFMFINASLFIPCMLPHLSLVALWLWTLWSIYSLHKVKAVKMITKENISSGKAAKELIRGMVDIQVISNRWKRTHIAQLIYSTIVILFNMYALFLSYEQHSYSGSKAASSTATFTAALTALILLVYFGLVWASCLATGFVNDNYFKEINIRFLEVLAGVKNVKHETTIEKVSRRNKYRLKEGKGGTSTKNVDTSDIEVEISRVEVDVEREVLTVEHRLRLHNLRHITQMKGTMGLNYGGIVLSFKSGLAIGTFITTALYSLLSSAVNAAL